MDNEINLSGLDERYGNDEAGAANDPAVLLRVVLFACSRGITSSKRIAQACEENVVSGSRKRAARIERGQPSAFHDDCRFHQLDGCKISSNCAKEWSGSKAELRKKAETTDKRRASEAR